MALAVSANGDRKKSGDKAGETLRFDIELDSPSDDTFNEFSYLQLVRERKQKVFVAMHSVLDNCETVPTPLVYMAQTGASKEAYFLMHFKNKASSGHLCS